MNNDVENRKFERSQFFLVQKDKDFLPIWVFKPEDNPSGMLGVLVDVSQGGLQILMQKNSLVEGQQFEMSLINQIGGDEIRLPPGIIELVWSSEVGSTYTKCGFTFNSYSSDEISMLIAQTFDGENKFMRCILRETNQNKLM
ncbi:PilZ domain-containing protein [Undibacterium sp. Xuan67W]|uniref:PilZ domain-containing protein n=1 Tax=Undibacterium sp. Xuan67W TaxID=3413057 RepID=UPI003BF0DF41